MRRTTRLTTLGILGLALLAPSGTASGAPADAVTCGGRPATIVGSTPTVTGTQGADVIVTGSADRVLALGGDDLVCVSEGTRVVQVDAGTGDDVVLLDGTALAPGSSLDGGTGDDLLAASRTTGTLELDLRWLHRLVVDGQPVAGVVGVEDVFATGPEVWVLGDDGDNDLRSHACTASLIGAGGDDRITALAGDPWFDRSPLACEPTVSVLGGDGDDVVRGSRGDDLLTGDDGRDRIEGRGGSDQITGNGNRDVLGGGAGWDRVRGNEGRDVVRGNAGPDFLVGGPGRDTADGSAGRDRCFAERERRCER